MRRLGPGGLPRCAGCTIKRLSTERLATNKKTVGLSLRMRYGLSFCSALAAASYSARLLVRL